MPPTTGGPCGTSEASGWIRCGVASPGRTRLRRGAVTAQEPHRGMADALYPRYCRPCRRLGRWPTWHQATRPIGPGDMALSRVEQRLAGLEGAVLYLPFQCEGGRAVGRGDEPVLVAVVNQPLCECVESRLAVRYLRLLLNRKMWHDEAVADIDTELIAASPTGRVRVQPGSEPFRLHWFVWGIKVVGREAPLPAIPTYVDQPTGIPDRVDASGNLRHRFVRPVSEPIAPSGFEQMRLGSARRHLVFPSGCCVFTGPYCAFVAWSPQRLDKKAG